MNKQINNVVLLGVTILLLSACGQFATPGTPNTSTPTVLPSSVENTPTSAPAEASDPEQFRKYVGSIHPPFSDGLSDDFGMLIQGAEDHALMLVREGENKMLWLDKFTHYDSQGTAYWQVKDVLDLSNLEAGLILIPDGCSINGVPDSKIIVAAKDGTVRLAWRVNTTLDRFEVIPTNSIACNSDKAMDL